MTFKVVLFLLASCLLVTTRVSSKDEEVFMEAAYSGKAPVEAPVHSPMKSPIPTPPVKPPAPAPALPIKPPVPAPKPPTKTKIECVPLCAERCKNHSRKNVCGRVCLTCCDRCKCVPPGTYGNQEKCGTCYTGMTTHGGRFKCP